jgi:hypothetical protein
MKNQSHLVAQKLLGARGRSARGSRCGLFRVVTRHIFRPSARQSIKTVVTCLCFVPPPTPPSPRRLTGALSHYQRERERHASSEPERERKTTPNSRQTRRPRALCTDKLHPFCFLPRCIFLEPFISTIASQGSAQHSCGAQGARGCKRYQRLLWFCALSLSSSAQEFLSARARNENRAHFAHGRCGAQGEKQNGKYKAALATCFSPAENGKCFCAVDYCDG